MNPIQYVHGYSEKEFERLKDQAQTLTELLHKDTRYPPRSLVLEAGCGIGAQTISLAKNNPHTQIISLDISSESIYTAKNRMKKTGYIINFLSGNLFLSLKMKASITFCLFCIRAFE